MIFNNAIDAVRSAVFFAEKSKLTYAIYAFGSGFTIKPLTQANGLELEIIKP
ncbi:hypothetical protein D9M71_570820 [compost metagenome]